MTMTSRESLNFAERPRPTAQDPAGGQPEGTFTRYVQALSAKSDAVDEVFDDMWRELRAILAREIRRRSLWTSSPSFVGIYGWANWSAGELSPVSGRLAGAGHAGCTTGPLEELLTECYTSIFLQRLPRLMEQLRVRPSIDGLVVFYLRNFLHVRQRDHDPLGYRIFEVLRAAICDAVAAGELHVLRGDSSIRNETTLGSRAKADPEIASPPADLRPIAERWNHELLPGLVTATGAERRQLIERLRALLFHLEAEGIRVFRFKDLIDPLKYDIRSRWAALFDLDEGEAIHTKDDEGSLAVIRVFEPDSRWEEIDSFRKLAGCVAERIEAFDTARRTRRYLRTLWAFQRRFALDQNAEKPPSNRKLAALLHIPRERLPGLYATLGRLVRRCQETLSGVVVEINEPRRRSARNTGGRNA